MRWPLDDFEISDPYGMRLHPILGTWRMHWGLDFAAPAGAPIRAVTAGVIARSGTSSGAGHWVMLRTDDGVTFDHFHMLEPTPLPTGARVAEGDVIGRVGSTGASTGPHLHLELWAGTERIDPYPYLHDRITTAGPPARKERRFMRIVRLLDPQAEGACYLVTETGAAHIDRPRTLQELAARGIEVWEMYYGDFADWVRLIHAAGDDEHAITREHLAELGRRLGA